MQLYLLLLMITLYYAIQAGLVYVVPITKASSVIVAGGVVISLGWADGPFLFVQYKRILDFAFEWDSILPVFDFEISYGEENS